MDSPRTLCERLEAAAARAPDRVAVRDDRQAWTYRELVDRVERLATHLAARGVGRETLVGVAIERSVEMVAGLLAILRAGGTYLPVDLDQPAERLAFVARDAGLEFYVADERHLPRLPPAGAAIRVEEAFAGERRPPPSPSPGDRAYVLYTSGSTGRPKGVEIEHRSLDRLLEAVRDVLGFGPSDVFAATTALSFDIAATELYLPLVAGGCVRVVRRSDLDDRARFEGLLEECGATFLQATPSGWKRLVRLGWKGSPRLALLAAGEPLPSDLAGEMSRRGRVTWNLYGPTEATVYATAWRVPPGARTIRIGKPLPGWTVRLDEGGELWIGGEGVARGYLNRPELTRERFVDGFYRTGDLVRAGEDGDLEFLGRSDDQVKIRGHRVEPGEIEVAMREHPGVADAVVARRPDASGDDRLVAWFVPRAAPRTAGDEGFARLFDAAYRHPGARGDAFPIGTGRVLTGYHRSDTGRPCAPEELRELADTTVARLLALGARRVYEIGCGVGLLALPLAAACERYAGCDVAAAGVEYVRRELAAAGRAGAEVWQGDANDFARVPEGAFDLVVLNSVVQYFPDEEYARSVLVQAAGRVAPGGVVFVGDVRPADLHEAFLRDVLAARGGGELEARLLAARENEPELLFRPEFFHALALETPGIDRVRIELREGRFANEWNRFRYDVFLHVRSGARIPAESRVVRWTTLEDVEAILRRGETDPFLVEAVPNARLPGRAGGVDPDRFRELAARHGRPVSIPWSRSGEPGDYDVQFGDGPAHRPDRYGPLGPPAAYARGRRDLAREAALAAGLRSHLLARLPEWMVPSRFVAMRAFPLNASGKVDKGALAAPEGVRPALAAAYVAPRNEAERRVARLVEEQLGVSPAGMHDDFFDLGGNSISVLSILGRMEEEWGVRASLMDFLLAPTIENLARLSGVAAAEGAPGPLVPVRPGGSGTPFFCVHGAGGLAYPLVDLASQLGDRPVWLVQDPAYSGRCPRAGSLEALAAGYVAAVREVRPTGPYALGGYCFGGVVACEMAHQLRAAGEEVRLLALVDTPTPRDFLAGLGRSRRAVRVARAIFQMTRAFLVHYSADQLYVVLATRRSGRSPGRIEGRVFEWVKRRSTLAQILPEDSVILSTRHPETAQVRELGLHHDRIMHRYEPRAYDGRVAAIRSTLRTVFTEPYDDELLGWREWLAGPVETRFVDGASHFTMPRRPYVLRLAEHLRELLSATDR